MARRCAHFLITADDGLPTLQRCLSRVAAMNLPIPRLSYVSTGPNTRIELTVSNADPASAELLQRRLQRLVDVRSVRHDLLDALTDAAEP